MTDMITPASLRAHAEHMEHVHLDGISAEEMRQEAARLEAESARDEEARKYAMKLGAQARLAFATVKGSLEEVNFAAGEHILAVLAADGRLLPEGGTVLAADEADDVRTFMRWAAGRNNGLKYPDEAAYRIRVKFGLYDSWVPVPPAASVPDSGPDGTPEKPWPTWQDVPGGVEYKDTEGDRYVNREGVRWKVFGPGRSTRNCALNGDWLNEHCAPFVRVDGDKA